MITQIAQNINNNIEGAIVQPSYYIENEKLIITSGKTNVNPMLMWNIELLPEQGISEQKQKDCLENM